MKDQETIARFIHLRAQGWSFDRISTEIKVSKPTLIQWSRQFQFDIANLRAIETEALAETLLVSRQERWKQLAKHLCLVEEELAKRTFDTVPTARLLTLAQKLRSEIERDSGHLKFSISVSDIPNDERVETILDWQV